MLYINILRIKQGKETDKQARKHKNRECSVACLGRRGHRFKVDLPPPLNLKPQKKSHKH